MRALAAEQLLREAQSLMDRMDNDGSAIGGTVDPVTPDEESATRTAIRVHLGSLPLKREPGPRRKK